MKIEINTFKQNFCVTAATLSCCGGDTSGNTRDFKQKNLIYASGRKPEPSRLNGRQGHGKYGLLFLLTRAPDSHSNVLARLVGEFCMEHMESNVQIEWRVSNMVSHFVPRQVGFKFYKYAWFSPPQRLAFILNR